MMKFEYCGKKIMGLMQDVFTDTKDDNEIIIDTIPTLKQVKINECPLNRTMRRNFQNKRTICYMCMQSKENTN